jgi:hypothetical protein
MFRLILRFATKVLDHRSFRFMILEYVPRSVRCALATDDGLFWGLHHDQEEFKIM